MGLFLIGYILLMSLYGFIMMGMDKSRAKRHQWRISESRIWVASICGGAIGTFVGMHLFHHKTKHKQFFYGLPIFAVIWGIGYLYLLLTVYHV